MRIIKNFEQDTQVLIGQPKPYPDILVLEMKNAFKNDLSVKKAYLACIQYPKPNTPVKLLIGIDGDDITSTASKLESYLLKKGIRLEEVDFVNADEDPFKNYFLKIGAFYTA